MWNVEDDVWGGPDDDPGVDCGVKWGVVTAAVVDITGWRAGG